MVARDGPARAELRTSRLSDASGSRELADERFGELSGGQRQRVLVARALVQDAPVLLLDEPFTGVDRPSAELLETLIAELAAEGRGVLIATHDLDQALALGRGPVPEPPDGRVRAPGRDADAAVLERTYGGAVVLLPGEGAPAGILPAHHHGEDHGHA